MSELLYAPINKWTAITGMNRTATYAALSRGELRAIKLGRRTLIDVPAGLAWLASLPNATINLGKKAA